MSLDLYRLTSDQFYILTIKINPRSLDVRSNEHPSINDALINKSLECIQQAMNIEKGLNKWSEFIRNKKLELHAKVYRERRAWLALFIKTFYERQSEFKIWYAEPSDLNLLCRQPIYLFFGFSSKITRKKTFFRTNKMLRKIKTKRKEEWDDNC